MLSQEQLEKMEAIRLRLEREATERLCPGCVDQVLRGDYESANSYLKPSK